MIDHTGIRVADIAKSRAFYAAALAPLGYSIHLDFGTALGFGEGSAPESDPGGDFWLAAGEPHQPRTHIAFRAESPAAVSAFHAAALAAGATDNGAPGFRPQYSKGYYAAFVLDPDGYNIEAVCHLPG